MSRRHHPADGPLHRADAVAAADADTAKGRDSVSVDSVGGVSSEEEHDTVFAYTRRQALEDDVLVDVTRQASPVEMHGGFVVPVAVTAALWAAIEAIPASLVGLADVRGRLHDVLFMAGVAARRQATSFASCAGLHSARFDVHLPYRGTRKRLHELVVAIGADDDGGPCITIGFPEDF